MLYRRTCIISTILTLDQLKVISSGAFCYTIHMSNCSFRFIICIMFVWSEGLHQDLSRTTSYHLAFMVKLKVLNASSTVACSMIRGLSFVVPLKPTYCLSSPSYIDVKVTWSGIIFISWWRQNVKASWQLPSAQTALYLLFSHHCFNITELSIFFHYVVSLQYKWLCPCNLDVFMLWIQSWFVLLPLLKK